MVVDNDEVIVKRKASYIAGVRNDVHIVKSLILSRFFRKCSSHNDRSVQMILVAAGASAFDCYVQRVSIQMGLLKAIKYSTFKVSALNGIVDEWTERMNILGVDFMRFTSGDFEQT